MATIGFDREGQDERRGKNKKRDETATGAAARRTAVSSHNNKIIVRVMLTAEYDGGHRAHDAEERAVDRVYLGRCFVGHFADGWWLQIKKYRGKKEKVRVMNGRRRRRRSFEQTRVREENGKSPTGR